MITLRSIAWLSLCALAAGSASIAAAASPARYHDELSLSAFLSTDAAESAAGRQLVDIEVRDGAGGPFFSGVWYPVSGTTWRWIHGDATAWDDFLDLVATKQGRWLDVEVGIFSGQKRWSGIFLEDGDSYAWEVRTTNDDAGFQTELEDNLRAGRQIIDFEAYVENGQTTYGGVWVNDPNQPRTTLYHGLTSAEVNDIFNPQLPIDPASGISPIDGIAGRPIDFEAYFSTLHNKYRYAIIMAMYPGHEWALWFGQTQTDFDDKNDVESDDNTHLIDLEVYNVGGTVRWAGIWGDTYKSLHEVSSIPADPDPEPMNANLQALVTQFEAPDAQGPLGIVGLYAKNTRSNQSVGYRAGEPFYLASCTKVAIHIRMWQMHEAGQIDILNDPPFTFTKNPWYVEDKPGGFDQFDFGNQFSWNTVDRYMIRASDNAATSIIMESIVGRERMNDWLSGVAGVGRGFGLITGITELDRVIMWQGQVQNFPNDPSYFLIPSYIWEPSFRGMTDVFGDLQAWANVNNGGTIPSRSDSQGHFRYYRMGMNTAEPRAFGRLLEDYMDGDYFTDPVNTLPLSLANFGSGTQLVDNLDGTAFFPGFPALPEPTSLTVYSKNGGKGGVLCNGTRYQVVNDTAIIQKGPETIVMAVFCRDNLVCNSNCVPAIPNCRPTTASPPGNAIRSFFHARFGYELFSQLIADLKD
ncbi:MAG: serine hydrolase, partial [Planctomycetes bacterium]|nr:serine hydrolase [Planctomycetota bacterium]